MILSYRQMRNRIEDVSHVDYFHFSLLIFNVLIIAKNLMMILLLLIRKTMVMMLMMLLMLMMMMMVIKYYILEFRYIFFYLKAQSFFEFS